jgi:aspartate/methionine/tyrosine aminotransferase
MVDLPSSWAMPYQAADAGGVVPPLDIAIRAVHRIAGNVDPDSGQLMVCTGARGCALAVLYGMNQVYGKAAGMPLQVFARAPFFALYPLWVPLASTGLPTDAVWNASADPLATTTVEILGSPNNPDGAPLVPVVKNKSHVLCDHVYNWGWNHYSPVDLGCDVSIFSISKATGHCGSRVGWAFVKDPRVFAAASMYNKFTAGGVSVEGQARAYTVLQRVVETNGSFFGVARGILESRWDQLDSVLPKCIASGVFTAFNKQHRGPLLWLTSPQAKDAPAILAAAGILGEEGVNFGGSAFNARLNLCVGPSDWSLVLARLDKLCGSPAHVVWDAVDRVDLASVRERSSMSRFMA